MTNKPLGQVFHHQICLQRQHSQRSASGVTEQQKHTIITEGLDYLNQHKMKTTAHSRNCIEVSLNNEPEAIGETHDVKKMPGDLLFRECVGSASNSTKVKNYKQVILDKCELGTRQMEQSVYLDTCSCSSCGKTKILIIENIKLRCKVKDILAEVIQLEQTLELQEKENQELRLLVACGLKKATQEQDARIRLEREYGQLLKTENQRFCRVKLLLKLQQGVIKRCRENWAVREEERRHQQQMELKVVAGMKEKLGEMKASDEAPLAKVYELRKTLKDKAEEEENSASQKRIEYREVHLEAGFHWREVQRRREQTEKDKKVIEIFQEEMQRWQESMITKFKFKMCKEKTKMRLKLRTEFKELKQKFLRKTLKSAVNMKQLSKMRLREEQLSWLEERDLLVTEYVQSQSEARVIEWFLRNAGMKKDIRIKELEVGLQMQAEQEGWDSRRDTGYNLMTVTRSWEEGTWSSQTRSEENVYP